MIEIPGKEGCYIYHLELKCLNCSRPVGYMRSTTEQAPADAVVPPRMRCKVCGGWPTFSGDWTRYWDGPKIVLDLVAS